MYRNRKTNSGFYFQTDGSINSGLSLKKKKSRKFHLFKTVIVVADIYVPASIFFNSIYDIIFLGCFYLALKFLFFAVNSRLMSHNWG